ncbi:MAG: hypothetical protein [Microviridae sp.]|nr:MAG: hypothetical protein [Microviridae sp.]
MLRVAGRIFRLCVVDGGCSAMLPPDSGVPGGSGGAFKALSPGRHRLDERALRELYRLQDESSGRVGKAVRGRGKRVAVQLVFDFDV